ncbi:hypothetical protein [Anaerobaca lacustris]|uniref:HEAT repeat domain-containing protein n=1 Tax=Anaerobaca lacustris TaxID=3044600 RepID=A0AAW6U6I3_9BACT|nr:hypothetical protein [Sedimentisphaerales bacterium M17dextr]
MQTSGRKPEALARHVTTLHFISALMVAWLMSGCAGGLDSRYPNVRQAAVRRVTNQALLAKVAVEDEDGNVRGAAVAKLTDQALLAKVAVGDKDGNVRGAAVERLTDQALLAKVAVEDEDGNVRRLAVAKLTDQALLAKVAVEDRDMIVRLTAIGGLRDRAVLQTVLQRFKDREGFYAHDHEGSYAHEIARLRLCLVDPYMERSLGRTHVMVGLTLKEQGYGLANSAFAFPTIMHTLHGHVLSVVVFGDRLPRQISMSWYPSFPYRSTRLSYAIPARVDISDILRPLLATVPQAGLELLAVNSPLAEVRQAAVINLTDKRLLARPEIQALLAEVAEAKGYQFVHVSRAAVMKLTDETLLARPAIQARLAEVASRARDDVAGKAAGKAAVNKLTDQALLAKVAVEGDSWRVKMAAVNKLTDQALLAKVAVEAKSHFRQAAVEKLTDQALLATVAADDEDSFVRNAAKRRLRALRRGR